jgi:hypothetical protein
MVTALFPTTSPVPPVTVAVASAPTVAATTAVVVPAGRLTVEPGVAATPSTVREVRAVRLEAALAADTPIVARPADDGRSRAKIVKSDTRFDLNTLCLPLSV